MLYLKKLHRLFQTPYFGLKSLIGRRFWVILDSLSLTQEDYSDNDPGAGGDPTVTSQPMGGGGGAPPNMNAGPTVYAMPPPPNSSFPSEATSLNPADKVTYTPGNTLTHLSGFYLINIRLKFKFKGAYIVLVVP